jgi:hypothetical protein
MDNPAHEHYIAVCDIIQYLASTLDEGIYYWCQAPVASLPDAPLPTTHCDNHTLNNDIFNESKSDAVYAFADSDWGSNKSHCKSITGIVIMFANGIVGCKTKYQDTIAHSSTEAKFVAACDTAKLILFFRSILDELGYSSGSSYNHI